MEYQKGLGKGKFFVLILSMIFLLSFVSATDADCKFKVDFIEWKNWNGGDLRDSIFVGEETSYYDLGEWISLEKTDRKNGFNIDVPGLAVERQKDRLMIYLYGSHPGGNGDREAINGYVTIEGGKFTNVINSATRPYEKWDDGIGSFGDASQDTASLTSSTVSNFITAVTAGNDAYYIYYVCDEVCDEDIVNGTSDWVNVSECVGGLINQERTRTEYDAYSCGDFANVTYTDTQSVPCVVPCDEEIINGTWSAWVNQTECSANLTLVQVRTITEFDNNSCGVFDDVVHTEARDVNCSLPVCSFDSDCEDDYYGDRYCKGDDVYKDLHDFSCVNGSCVEDVSEEFVKECDDDCDDGYCEDDDDDNSWNDNEVVWIRRANFSSDVIVLDEPVEEGSYWWVWILLLVLLVLFLAWAIFRILNA